MSERQHVSAEMMQSTGLQQSMVCQSSGLGRYCMQPVYSDSASYA